MLGAFRSLGVSRIGAALVALALTGAPRLALHPAHAAEHRCTCKAHGKEHACTCPVCQAAAARSRLEEAEKLPPCHRAAARAAAEAPQRSPPGPCITGSCGAPEELRATPNGLDPFTLPQAAAPPLPWATPGLLPPPGAPRQVAHAPEPPRPRRA